MEDKVDAVDKIDWYFPVNTVNVVNLVNITFLFKKISLNFSKSSPVPTFTFPSMELALGYLHSNLRPFIQALWIAFDGT